MLRENSIRTSTVSEPLAGSSCSHLFKCDSAVPPEGSRKKPACPNVKTFELCYDVAAPCPSPAEQIQLTINFRLRHVCREVFMPSVALEHRARSARYQLILIALGLLLPAFAYSGILFANFASA